MPVVEDWHARQVFMQVRAYRDVKRNIDALSLYVISQVSNIC